MGDGFLIIMDKKDYRTPETVEMHDELISRYYKISARNEGQLNMLEKFFVYIQYLSSIGASRMVNVYVDGDGAVSLKFASHGEDEFVFHLPLKTGLRLGLNRIIEASGIAMAAPPLPCPRATWPFGWRSGPRTSAATGATKRPGR